MYMNVKIAKIDMLKHGTIRHTLYMVFNQKTFQEILK